MARLLKSDRTPERSGRRLSFKTRERKAGVRSVRVVSGAVSDIAAKFNAVVVEDQGELLRKLHDEHQGAQVRATVHKFEAMGGQRTRVLLVRRNSAAVQEKPKVHPKPTMSVGRVSAGSYVKKDMREIIGKDKKFSLPRTHILDEVLNEVPDEKKPVKATKIHRSGKIRKNTSPEPTQQLDSKPSGTTKVTDDMKSKTYENTKFDEIKEKLLRCTVGTIEPSEVESVKTSCDASTEKSEQLKNTKTEQSITITLTAPEPKSPEEQKEQLIDSNNAEKEISKMIKPNRSFLWGVTESVTETDVVVTEAEVITNSEESAVKSAQATSQATSDRLVEDKENLEKLETPVIRKVDKKGYGKINVVANSSSLYRNILRQSLIEELKERATVLKDRSENIPQEEPPMKKEDHQEEYEDVGQDTYEVIENNYDEIREDAIYDDVLHSEQIYESIYGGRLLGDCDTYSGRVPGDSDSSCDQSNSLYGLRPPSRSSSGSGARGSAASRSDSSDDWVDIEMEEQQHQHHILLIEAAGQKRSGGNWSQKVRRQWSARKADLQCDEVSISSTSLLYLNCDPEVTPPEAQPVPLNTLGLVSLREVWFSGSAYEVQEVTIYILNRADDSDSCGKHYELVENLDDDSALCDDFEDSSDSEFSVENNEKAFVHEERIRESDGIYGLMKEAGKRMRKTSSTIGKSLRKISRISKTTSAQDIFNGTNGMMSRGRWPSFKKKNSLPQTKSTFYLTDSGLSTGSTSSVKAREPASVPPPRPPPPDPRRLSLSTRPTSPPPPPPPAIVNGTSGNDSKTAVNKAINDTSLYAECGLFEQNPNAAGLPSELRRLHDNSWYSDIGLYENSKPSDTCSDHDSSRGSDLDLRFADEPLYQFYAERVAKRELSEDISETWYEEIGENRIVQPTSRPTALELVSPEMQRTLWCQVPQVIESGILDSLSTERKKLQEAKFEVVTSEASYYKSLSILEKHFAASPLLKDESILPKVHYKTLFSNVASVRKCSEAVLAALEKCWQESILLEGLSEVINKVAEENFSAYIKYCKHQLAMEKTIKFLKKSNQAFSDALDTLEKSPMCHNLTFYSFVLLPMQRITRMPLLQDAILTKLTPDDPEYDSCRIALARLNKIVHDCNEAARQTERLEEMVMLSRALQFPPEIRPLPLMSASRWLVRSGDVSQISLEPRTTFSRKLTTPRTVKLRLFLFTDYLVIAKKKSEDSFSVVTYCERNLVHMSDVEEAFSNKFLIMLTLIKNHEGKTQEMVLCCGGESSRARWISAMSPPAATNPGERLYEGWDCPQVFVQHAYLAGQPDELSLQYGDVIDVLRKTDDGWYYGERMRDSEKGWFPGNHTSEIPSSHVRARNLKQRYRLLALSSSFIQKQQMSKLNPS